MICIEKNFLIKNLSYISAFILVVAMVIQETNTQTSSSTVTPVVNTTCLVDRCASCPDQTNLTCTACKSGYYLRSYSSASKPYNACWSVSKLLLFMFSTVLLSLLACTLCYLCYKCGQKASNIRGNPYLQSKNSETIPLSPRSSERRTAKRPYTPPQQPQQRPMMAPVYSPSSVVRPMP